MNIRLDDLEVKNGMHKTLKTILFLSLVMIICIYSEGNSLASELYSCCDYQKQIIKIGEKQTIVHIAKVPLNSKVSFQLVYNKADMDGFATLKDIIQNKNIFFAINGDFFISTNKMMPIGPMVEDGKLLVSPNGWESYKVLGREKNGHYRIQSWNYNGEIITASKTVIKVDYYNKRYGNDGISVLGPRWGHNLPLQNESNRVLEFLVRNNVILKKANVVIDVTIPDGSYIISARGKSCDVLQKELKVGDKVSFQQKTTPDYRAFSMAIGVGNQIISKGTIVNCEPKLMGRHPLVAVAFTKDQKDVLFVVAEGRKYDSLGFTEAEMANVIKGLGGYDAVLLDGGVSSQMILRDKNDCLQIVNDAKPRMVPNGIALLKNN